MEQSFVKLRLDAQFVEVINKANLKLMKTPLCNISKNSLGKLTLLQQEMLLDRIFDNAISSRKKNTTSTYSEPKNLRHDPSF